MVTVTSKVERFVKRQNPGTVFSFNTVVSRLKVNQKDTVNHALKKLVDTNEIIHVKKGIYARPKMSRFGAIPVDPSTVVEVMAKNIGASVYPYGASVLNALGLSTQLSMSYSYISTKRIASFELGGTVIQIRFSRALKDADESITGLSRIEKKKVLILWSALEYLGEKDSISAQSALRRIYSELSVKARKKLVHSFRRKLNWAKDILL